eukprot:scaffold10085_cov168-Amphora_coffeaeformis.AAC.6
MEEAQVRMLQQQQQGDDLTWQKMFTVAVLTVMFATLITDKMGTDSVMLTALTVFYISDIISIQQALAGFSSQGLLTVLALFVVAEGLHKTGALDYYVGQLLGKARTVSGAQLRVMLPIVALSGFINDTPLVTVTLPVVLAWAAKIQIPPRLLLMPLSFAALLGGVCTLMGTSTNLVVVGLVQQYYPDNPQLQNMGLLDLGRYGVPVALLGTAYVVLVTPWLLPSSSFSSSSRDDVTSLVSNNTTTENILLGARVLSWSPAAGRTIRRSGLRDTGGIYLVRVQRDATGNVHHAVSPDFVLQVGDVLYFTGLVESFGEFCAEHGLQVVTNEQVSDGEGRYSNTRSANKVSNVESEKNETSGTVASSPFTIQEEVFRDQIGLTLDSILHANPQECMRVVYQIEDAIRDGTSSPLSFSSMVEAGSHIPRTSLAHRKENVPFEVCGRDLHSLPSNDVRVVVTQADEGLIVIAIDCPDRSGLLLDISKCLARLQLEVHHTEAKVRSDRSLSVWRCETLASSVNSNDFVSEIWSILQAMLTKKNVTTAKKLGLRVCRARVQKGRLVGAQAGQIDFRNTYKAGIVAIQRHGKCLLEFSAVVFAEGDVLVLQASTDSPLLETPPYGFYDDSEPAEEQSEEAVWRELRVIAADETFGTREFLTAMTVEPSQLVGKTLTEAGIDKMPSLFLVSHERPVPLPDTAGTQTTSFEVLLTNTPLHVGDVLWFSGTASSVGDLRKIPGLISCEIEEVNKLNEKVYNRRLVEAVVARKGPLVGRTIKEVRFRTQYGAAVIAVQREGKRVHDNPGNVKLHAGDVLLLEAGTSFTANKVKHDRSFALVAEVKGSAPPRLRMLLPAIILTLGAYGCFMVELSTLWGCAMVASILMVMLGIMSESEARDAIKWELYLTIAAAFGIGNALVNSGVAKVLADFLVKVGHAVGLGDAGLLGAVYLSTVLISQVVANNAAAALMFPIAMGAAESTQTDLKLMSYTIMLAASAAFMTPFGYQTNLMVMGPGGYSTVDFLIFGTPMQIVLLVGTTIILVTPMWASWLVSLLVLIGISALRIAGDLRKLRLKEQ